MIKYTRNKSLYISLNREDNFSDRLILFLLHFAFFLKNFKNKEYITPVFIEDKYGIWLIGYDGNIKNYTDDDKMFLELFDLIDSMPIRKNEMIDDKC